MVKNKKQSLIVKDQVGLVIKLWKYPKFLQKDKEDP